MNTSSITVQEIAEVLDISVQAVHKRAKKELWKFEKVKSPGGFQKVFIINALPEVVKTAIYTHNNRTLEELPTPSNLPAVRPAAKPPKPIIEGVQTPIRITLDQQPQALAKASIIKLYTGAVDRAAYGAKEKAKSDFIMAYNSGLLYPELYQRLGTLSVKTIEAWKLKLKAAKDCFALADQRGKWRKGVTRLSAENTQILLNCALHPNKLLISEAIRLALRIMHKNDVPNGASEQTYRRWLENWIANNYNTWVMTRSGNKAHNDLCLFSIPRDYSRLEVGDVLIADGHVLNFEIINPFTGKPKRMALILWYDMVSSFPLGWEIMPTENTQGIASSLRRAIIQLGKIPKIAYLDNGRAFSSRFFNGEDLSPVTGLFERLGMETIFAWPYHGQSKTIERFFKTFGELERLSPTTVGSCIDAKPARLLRNEVLHRRIFDQGAGGKGLTLWQAHSLVAAWFDDYICRAQRGHLQGKCPLDMLEPAKGPGVDPMALRYLMMAEHISQPSKEGIRFMGQNYYHPDLASLRKKVLIRYDLQDRESVLVFEADDSAYICTASVLQSCHPVASILGTDADRAHLSNMIEMKRSVEKKASTLCRDLLHTTIMPEYSRMISMIPEPQPAGLPAPETKSLPSPQEIAADAEIRMAENQEFHSRQELDRRQAEMEYILAADFEETFRPPETLGAAADLRYELENLSEADRYERLMDMEVMGQLITKQYQAFMRYFELSPAYIRYQDYYESRKAGLRAALSKDK